MKRSRLLAKLLLPVCLQRVFGIPRSSLYGEARWMGWRERRQFLSRRHTGLVLSPGRRLSEEESCKHIMVIAATGMGKTTCYAIPNLLELIGSAVVTDPSGEIYRKTSGHLKQRGFAIQVLQPALPERSLRFNPLHYYRSDTELRRLAGILAGTASGGEGNVFWRIGATDALHLCLQAVTALPDPADRTIGNVYLLLNTLSADEAAAGAFMARSLEGEAFGKYRAFMGQEEREKSYHLSTARAALELWTDKGVCRFSGANTVDIGLLRKQPTVIYLIVPGHKVRYYGTLLNLFYSACFEHCIDNDPEPDDLPVYFFLGGVKKLLLPLC
jgi:type IV secretion system protein VirD4